MGNMYTAPKRTGSSPFTRSGEAPVKLERQSDQPLHRFREPMSLELHMADERQRTAGLSAAEREWRKKWLKDQHLHPDEPIHVDAVHRQLNPIRVLYRRPWDILYKRVLEPTFGTYYGLGIRMFVPKFLLGVIGLQIMYYQWKYNSKDWQRIRGIHTPPIQHELTKVDEIRQEHPGLLDKAFDDPAKYRYFDSSYYNRDVAKDVGESARKY